jgi:hypothetical protein
MAGPTVKVHRLLAAQKLHVGPDEQARMWEDATSLQRCSFRFSVSSTCRNIAIDDIHAYVDILYVNFH